MQIGDWLIEAAVASSSRLQIVKTFLSITPQQRRVLSGFFLPINQTFFFLLAQFLGERFNVNNSHQCRYFQNLKFLLASVEVLHSLFSL